MYSARTSIASLQVIPTAVLSGRGGRTGRSPGALRSGDAQRVSVRITRQEARAEAERAVGQLHHAWRHEDGPAGPQTRRGRRRIGEADGSMPVHQIVDGRICWSWPSGARAQVLEQLDAGSGRGAHRGDAEARPDDVVEPRLLRTPVQALPCESQAQDVPI